MFKSLIFTVIVLSNSFHVFGFGEIGHEIIGEMASNFISEETSSKIETLLNADPDNKYAVPLSRVGTWADRIKGNNNYRYASKFHYTSVVDNPPDYCSSPDELLCPKGVGGCIIDAIGNYSQQLMDNSMGHSNRVEAFKFLVHLIEDLHQPLHISGKKRGGNDVPVVFAGKHSNLHAIWDTNILRKYIADKFEGRDFFVQHLIQRIQSEESSGWTECSFTTFESQVKCVREWGGEMSTFNCNYIWKSYLKYKNSDLATDYYDEAVQADLVEYMLMRASVRLAFALDAVFLNAEI